MAKVTLMFRAAIDGKYPYLPAVQTANGRLEPNTAIYQGRKRTFEGGRYYLRLCDDGKQTYEAVGSDPSLALQRQIERRGQLDAKAARLHVEASVVQHADPTKPGLAEVIQKYLVETEGNKSKATLACYRNTMTLFQQSCKKHLPTKSPARTCSALSSSSGPATSLTCNATATTTFRTRQFF
jgi:hypothetical protein